MTKNFCDRCGQEIQIYPRRLNFQDEGLLRSVDLCTACFLHLKEFLGDA